MNEIETCIFILKHFTIFICSGTPLGNYVAFSVFSVAGYTIDYLLLLCCDDNLTGGNIPEYDPAHNLFWFFDALNLFWWVPEDFSNLEVTFFGYPLCDSFNMYKSTFLGFKLGGYIGQNIGYWLGYRLGDVATVVGVADPISYGIFELSGSLGYYLGGTLILPPLYAFIENIFFPVADVHLPNCMTYIYELTNECIINPIKIPLYEALGIPLEAPEIISEPEDFDFDEISLEALLKVLNALYTHYTTW